MQPRILIVDDEQRNTLLLESILEKEAYLPVIAGSGAEALRMVDEHRPDLILMDVNMPDMNGFEVCQVIKSNPAHRAIPILMVTALDHTQDRVKSMQSGADDFLSKPINATELVIRVRSLLRMRQLHQELERMTHERLRFMAGVAHNIRSPLTSLGLNMQLLGMHLPENGKVNEITRRIDSNIEQIRVMATDVMNYYQMETGQLQLNVQPVLLKDICMEVMTVAQTLADKYGVELICPPLPPLVLNGDRSALIQILLNLLGNAIKYTPHGGSVEARIYILPEDDYTLPESHFPPVLMLPPAAMIIEVDDDGPGIARGDYERVFSEFDRMQAEDGYIEGVGLGLPVSRQLIRLHGGELWFHSEEGVGSSFGFFLPL